MRVNILGNNSPYIWRHSVIPRDRENQDLQKTVQESPVHTDSSLRTQINLLVSCTETAQSKATPAARSEHTQPKSLLLEAFPTKRKQGCPLSCAGYKTLKRPHHFYGVHVKHVYPESNNEEVSDKTQMKDI